MKRKRADSSRLLAILIIILGIAYFYANLFIPRWIPKTIRVGTVRKPLNILVVGTDITFDKKTGEPLETVDGRTDSILILHIDPARYKINVLSIPRDSFVAVPGHGIQKINAANVLGGIDLLKKTLSELTGLKIDNYIEVNPYVVIKLVDILGGIKLYVEKDMVYTDRAQNLHINLKQGWHRLNGKETQDYLRFRHDMFGDIGRIERQQKVLQTIFVTLASPSNIVKSPLAIKTATNYVKTDLSLGQLVRLANFVRMLSGRDFHSFMAGGEPGASSFSGSIWLINKIDLETIIEENFR
ncbi:hypothetical protein A2311_01140 [candidate division WOR-1 bacterium RIFOXYB2_FULL_48_7]|uniref:Cell envelope-related transcriptional attenuator domain-containing protein n=1 Tax=candidate division WOR-1 bacterium RIFOXYB2_FULL_48_7 TaxID=1802583 RepID=A0A1F4TNT8_UNCSA|nr:MAG: hypothetical protein A2311_01140 [candidate division WOR-1 bacterium RIFOXYB2_FULL_48_7]